MRTLCTVPVDGDARWSSLCAREPGTRRAKFCSAMRHDDEDDPKKPQPIAVTKKGTNGVEAAEANSWLVRKDSDRDRHRHVV
jgi:hypothetical protein